jgi:hypothetical protein
VRARRHAARVVVHVLTGRRDDPGHVRPVSVLVQPLALRVREVHARRNPPPQLRHVRHAGIDHRHADPLAGDRHAQRQPGLHLVGGDRLDHAGHLPGDHVVARKRIDLGIARHVLEPVRRHPQQRAGRKALQHGQPVPRRQPVHLLLRRGEDHVGRLDVAVRRHQLRQILRQAPQFNAVMSGRGDLLGSVTGIVSTTLGAVVTVIVVMFVGLFVAANPQLYVAGVLRLVPQHRRDRIAEVMGATGYTLKWWMIGQGVDMIFIAVATGIGLWIIGVPLAFVLGSIAGLFIFIPNFCPLISLVPAVLLALAEDPN